MKSSSSCSNLIQLIFFLILLSSVSSKPQEEVAELVLSYRRLRGGCSSSNTIFTISPPSSPSVSRFRRKRMHYPPPPLFDEGDEIDPRYGVAKRLVPSGPNPLHNWSYQHNMYFEYKLGWNPMIQTIPYTYLRMINTRTWNIERGRNDDMSRET